MAKNVEFFLVQLAIGHGVRVLLLCDDVVLSVAGGLYVIIEYYHLYTGALYVIVEYCTHGCLREYLVKHRDDFVDTSVDLIEKPMPHDHAVTNEYVNTLSRVQPSQDAAANSTNLLHLTTKDLICFAFQIARGMEYLASRNVSYWLHYCTSSQFSLLVHALCTSVCHMPAFIIRTESYIRFTFAKCDQACHFEVSRSEVTVLISTNVRGHL